MIRNLIISLFLFFTMNFLNGQVVLNEIMYNPSGVDGGFVPGEVGEWIELYGPSGTDIGCYVITDGDWTITIPDGTTIPSDEFFVVGDAMFANTPDPTSGSVVVDLDVGTCGCTTGSNVPGLTNSGEYVVLFDENQNFLDGINFNDPNSSNLPSGTQTTTAVGTCPSTTVNIGAIAGSITILPGPDLSGGISRDADGFGNWGYIAPNDASPGESNLGGLFLPVKLVSFDVFPTENNLSAELKWKTSSEERNDYFSIQHSRDGIDFINIGRVEGVGFSREVNDYNFSHRNIPGGIHYYRLQQVDLDGASEFSKTVTIHLQKENIGFSVFPNPFLSNVTVQLDAPLNEQLEFQILNFSGQVVLEKTVEESNDSFLINLNDFPRGVYFLRIKTNREYLMRKLVKK